MVMNSRITSIFLQPLAIEPTFGVSELLRYGATSDQDFSLSMSKDMMQRSIEERNTIIYSANNLSPKTVNSNLEIQSVKNKAVAVVSLKGTMLSEGGLSTPSIDLTCGQIEAAASNVNIAAIVLRTNSGGGEVTAAQRLSNTLIEARKQKPVLMYVDGMAASGAYWAAAFCDEIVMGGDTTSVGSIGVVIEFSKERIAELKEDLQSILSDGSEGKRAFIQNLFEGNYAYIKQEVLNPTMAIFAKVVKNGRANSKNPLDLSFIKTDGNKLGGRMTRDANEAIRAGLADSKGTLQTAIKRALTLANNRRRAERMKSNLKIALG